MKTHRIHKTPEEQAAENTERSAEAMNKTTELLTEVVSQIKTLNQNQASEEFAKVNTNLSRVVTKLEEIKSASLITNRYLKDLAKILYNKP